MFNLYTDKQQRQKFQEFERSFGGDKHVLNQKRAAWLTKRGNFYGDLGHLKVAMEDLRGAIRCKPDYLAAIISLALVRQILYRRSKDIKHIIKVIELLSNLPETIAIANGITLPTALFQAWISFYFALTYAQIEDLVNARLHAELALASNLRHAQVPPGLLCLVGLSPKLAPAQLAFLDSVLAPERGLLTAGPLPLTSLATLPEPSGQGGLTTAVLEFLSLASLAGQGQVVPQLSLDGLNAQALAAPRDFSHAVYGYAKVAELGHASAQDFLGMAYEHGFGVPQDDRQALLWYARAVRQGHPSAQFNFGAMYYRGRHVAQDVGQAIHWFTQAAQQGHVMAQTLLGSIYYQGREAPPDLRLALYWYLRAAQQGDAAAQNVLGALFAKGRLLPQDARKAVHWLGLAAQQGLAMSQYNLGVIYAQGRGLPADPRQALAWFARAAKQGLPLAQYNLGLMFGRGQGVIQDDSQALYWLGQAADQGLSLAQCALGQMHAKGLCAPPDLVRAHMWTSLALAGNLESPVRHLGQQTLARLQERMSAQQLAQARRLAAQWSARPAA